MEQDTEYIKLPLEERCVHKVTYFIIHLSIYILTVRACAKNRSRLTCTFISGGVCMLKRFSDVLTLCSYGEHACMVIKNA